MVDTEFFVTRRAQGWFVDAGAEHHGPYLTKRDALADAFDAAEVAGKKAVVLVKVNGADASIVWRAGRGDARPDPDTV